MAVHRAQGMPVLVNVCTFSIYVLLGNELTATTAFTSLALFEVLQFPLTAFPRIVQAVLELQVSIKRLTHFFELPELEETLILENGTKADGPPAMYTTRDRRRFLRECALAVDASQRCTRATQAYGCTALDGTTYLVMKRYRCDFSKLLKSR